jgi:hypothetical protein
MENDQNKETSPEELAFFSRLDDENFVIQVIALPRTDLKNTEYPDSEVLGQEYIRNTIGLPGYWIETCYYGKIRKNYGLPKFYYDKEKDAFIPPRPYESWLYNEETFSWYPPISKPDDENVYIWNETIRNWEEDYEVD